MKPKDTEKLMELLKKSGSIDAYLQENKDFLLDCDIKEYLNVLIKEKHMTKTEVFEKACIKKFVGFGFLNKDNPRKPSRNNILAMLIVMNCNLDETQTALKIAKYDLFIPKMKETVLLFLELKILTLLMILNRIYMSMDLNVCENTNKTEFLRSVFIFMLYVG